MRGKRREHVSRTKRNRRPGIGQLTATLVATRKAAASKLAIVLCHDVAVSTTEFCESVKSGLICC